MVFPRPHAPLALAFALLVAAPSITRAETITLDWGGGAAVFDPSGAYGDFITYALSERFASEEHVYTANWGFLTGPATLFQVDVNEQSRYEFGPGLFFLNGTLFPLLSLSVRVREMPLQERPVREGEGHVAFEIGPGLLDAETRAGLGYGHRARVIGGGGTFDLDGMGRNPYLIPRYADHYNRPAIRLQVVPEPSIVTLIMLGAGALFTRGRSPRPKRASL